ncbi:MAG: hypothetical protein TEF_07935 [Rhizobiales bacterium NRL2]|nr:MAG: hypothetical protein TEF_07935 [Rhizobiales bacterium NRL2]
MTVRLAIAALAIGQTIVWAGTYYFFPAMLLRWETVEGWPKTTLTAAFAAALVLTALVSPLAGRLIDRGRGPQTIAGLAFVAAGLVALLPFAPNIWVFAALWLAIGVCMGGCLYEPCFALITRTRGAAARRAITMVTLVAGFASTVSFPLSHYVSREANWQTAAFVFAGLIAFAGAPLLLFGARTLERAHGAAGAAAPAETAHGGIAAAAERTVAQVLRSPVFLLLALAFALLSLNHAVIINHILPILDDRGVSPEQAVLAASLMGPMQVAGRVAMMLSERHLSNHVITTYCFGALLLATVCLFTASFWPLLIFAFVVLQGSGIGIFSIMKPVMTRDLLGEKNFGAIYGSLALPTMLAFALAPFLGTLLWAAGGYDFAIMVIGALTLAGLIAFRAASAQAHAAAGAGPRPS